ncbi:MAG TPA: hypothetical protein VNU92_05670 [Edaphobacter sp.]|jgi:hypothetical protein|nr:hypothetical protein [Edaphobacter sp.]
MRLLTKPLPLLLLVTALFTFLIQSGELGTSDTTHRLQVAHSFWTGEPQVFPNEYPEFGLHGRGGRLYAWYGIGQSLLLLPSDIAGTAISHLSLWQEYTSNGTDPAIRSIVVTFSTNILLNILTALVAFKFLTLLGFKTKESIAGTLALLLATTHLHYSQNMQENNYIFLLTLTGITLQYQWFTTGNKQALFLGSAALGLNLLTRITTVFDIFAVVTFLFLTTRFNHKEELIHRGAFKTYLQFTVPTYAFFVTLDRLYQYIRFDSWTTTYMTYFAIEGRKLDPSLPANYPFSGSIIHGMYSGILGPLFSPEKSIFLYDPLFPLTLMLAALLWKRLQPPIRSFLLTTLTLLVVYIVFYSRFLWWPGDFAWGARYISSIVQLASLLAIPLLLRYREDLSKTIYRFGLAVTAVSVIIQCASLAFWVPLEIYQIETFGHPTWLILLRFKNIIAFALGKREAWHLNTPAMFEDSWDAAHITAWNFLPSLLRHIGATPLWVVHLLYALWFAALLALLFTSVQLMCAARRCNNKE